MSVSLVILRHAKPVCCLVLVFWRNRMQPNDNDDDNYDEVCAACGKGSGSLKTCTACKLVKYCGVDCQRAHRPKHKRECKRRAAELHDEALFKQPPSQDECPICLLQLPLDGNDCVYQSCCGHTICQGCVLASMEADDNSCPFCRQPHAGVRL